MVKTRIRDLREDRDWTQKQVADRLKISRSTYAAYENEVNATPIEILIALSKLYSVSVDYLLFLTERPQTLR